jgi:beta-N-acetylhexosaminidase
MPSHPPDPYRPAAAPYPGPPLSRRRLLGAALAGSIATLLAACASREPTPGPSPTASPSPTDAPRPSSPPTSPPTASPPGAPPGASPTPAVSLGDRIAGLVIVGFRGSRLAAAPWLRSALADQGLGGVILFDRDQQTGGARNIESPRQVARLTAELRAAARGRGIIIAVDQEGGRVTRLSPVHGFPALASEAEIGRGTVAGARAWGRTMARTLADAGCNLNFAPVVDLDVNPSSPAIGALGRSFSANPDVVVHLASAEIRAHRAAGVRTTLKHFPGIGSSTGNTDVGVVDVTATWTRVELDPFARLIEAGLADLVMAAHVIDGGLDPDWPASLSRKVVGDLLRGTLGWDGIVVTDDLQAGAIVDVFGSDEAILLALEAGNDLLLFANQQAYDPGVVAHVVDLVTSAVRSGRLPEARIDEAWARVQRLFGRVPG